MNIASDCPVSLTPAQPGWVVRHTDPEGIGTDYQIIAWAVIALGSDDEGRIGTEVQPVFVAGGLPWTTVEYRANVDDDCSLEVVEP